MPLTATIRKYSISSMVRAAIVGVIARVIAIVAVSPDCSPIRTVAKMGRRIPIANTSASVGNTSSVNGVMRPSNGRAMSYNLTMAVVLVWAIGRMRDPY